MIVTIAGHEPLDLWGYSPNHNYRLLRETIARLCLQLIQRRGADRFLVFLARGVGAMAFDACLTIRDSDPIDLVAVIPYANQSGRWDSAQRERHDRRLILANEVVTVDELPDYGVDRVPMGTHDPENLLARNQYLVDHADLLLAVWSGIERGNTHDVVQRARAAGKEILRHHPFQYRRR